MVAAAATIGCREPSCEELHAASDWPGVIAACGAEYRATGRPAEGMRLADAHMRREEWPEVERIAGALAATTARGAAFRLRAMIERDRGAYALAAMYGSTALAIHAQEGDSRELLRDGHALAGIWWKDSAFDASLAAAELTRDLAATIGDRRAGGYGELGRADAFRMLGDRDAAAGALVAALGLFDRPCDRAWVHLKQGMLYLGQPLLTPAEISFAQALADATACGDRPVADAARLNRAWIAAKLGLVGDAERHLAAVEDPGIEVEFLRGLIALERGDLAAADAALGTAERAAQPDAEWPWAIADARAQIAEAQGDDVRAEAAYLRALAAIAELRRRAPDSTPHVVAAHRGPYEGLLALRARQGRWRDALAVVMDLDASGALPVTSAPGALWPAGLVETGASKAAAGAAPVARVLVSVDDVIAAWRGRDLAIVVATRPGIARPHRQRIWRLRVLDGTVTGVDVGDAAEAPALIDRLEHDPTDGAAAEALGAMIAPPGHGELHVLPVGGLGRIPLAALRSGGALVVASRPLLRVLGVLPQPRRTRRWTTAAVAIGDPRGDLPSAAREATRVARDERATLYLGAQATRASLASAADADLAHIAAHVDEQLGTIVLRLADGDVTPDELRAGGIAPRLAVLSSCGSAAARDEGGWGSLAAALLAGGTEVVIATQRSVGDDAAIDLVLRFYAANGRRSPAAALAAAQVELARTAATTDWAVFTALAGPPEMPPDRAVPAEPAW